MQFWKVQVANLRPTKSLSVQRMGTVFLEAWAAGIATPPPPFPAPSWSLVRSSDHLYLTSYFLPLLLPYNSPSPSYPLKQKYTSFRFKYFQLLL